MHAGRQQLQCAPAAGGAQLTQQLEMKREAGLGVPCRDGRDGQVVVLLALQVLETQRVGCALEPLRPGRHLLNANMHGHKRGHKHWPALPAVPCSACSALLCMRALACSCLPAASPRDGIRRRENEEDVLSRAQSKEREVRGGAPARARAPRGCTPRGARAGRRGGARRQPAAPALRACVGVGWRGRTIKS